MATIKQQVRTEDTRGRKALRERLKQARAEAGLGQTEVAYMAGCSQSYLSKVERTGRVDFVRLERLAAIYDKPLDWFRTLDPGATAHATWAPEEPAYLGLTRKEWKVAAKTKHWPVPRGWGNKWIRTLYDYDKDNYKGSPEYARIAGGEDFWSVFEWDGQRYVVTEKK